jgi:hypothetical protein
MSPVSEESFPSYISFVYTVLQLHYLGRLCPRGFLPAKISIRGDVLWRLQQIRELASIPRYMCHSIMSRRRALALSLLAPLPYTLYGIYGSIWREARAVDTCKRAMRSYVIVSVAPSPSAADGHAHTQHRLLATSSC